MRGLQKSKRVTWASSLNLCQVKLFLSEDSPSLVGLSSQDHLQAKRSLPSHPDGAGSDDILPPGFEGTHASSQFEIDLSQIPVVQWINPPKFVLDLAWQVVAGEESKEVEEQHKREMRVLEAIYPRPSSIPPNPAIAIDVEDSHSIDDGQTALIPITATEDEDVAVDAVSDSQSLELPPVIPRGPMQLAGVVSDVDAASVALTNIIKSNQHGNLFDHEVLNNILNNPEMIEKLVRDYGAANNLQYEHNHGSSSATYSHPHIPINQGETNIPSSVSLPATSYPPSTGGQVGPVATQWLPRSSISPVTVSPHVEVPSIKDANYYKSLIQQHGGDGKETLPYYSNRQMNQPVTTNHGTAHISRSRDSKPKIMKPCIFFNSSRGCRNGANCAYQHDVPLQPQGGGAMPRIQSSKRMKMDNS
ncbi:PREDICTED: zinc finger CCCH domain-containing protein 6-like [Lupinus angustifolius]|uniref:zinc finger CCCH domain-containing protein 6-like n=1 Tax=Lupinus angustifolius TaxID=3871 RepID=UPI00092E50CC|nr:PREDICTED: zinc finger CCCH domain-containing protein 6-like [Lupinus angustifolius]